MCDEAVSAPFQESQLRQLLATYTHAANAPGIHITCDLTTA